MTANYSHDVYRHISASNLTVNSTSATSTSSVSSQTRFVQLLPVLASSAQPSGGVWYTISEVGATAVDSTTGTFLAAGWPEVVKITPGQMVQALASNATVTNLSITQETD